MNNDQEEKLSALEWMLQTGGDDALQVVGVGSKGTVRIGDADEEEIEVIATWTRPDSDG
jgi:hypothetical protein